MNILKGKEDVDISGKMRFKYFRENSKKISKRKGEEQIRGERRENIEGKMRG